MIPMIQFEQTMKCVALVLAFCGAGFNSEAQPQEAATAAPLAAISVIERLQVGAGDKQEMRFEAPPVPAGREAVLSLRARLQTPKVAGYTPAMKLTLNGQAIGGLRLLNKKPGAEVLSGRVFNPAAGEIFVVPYAPDFKSANTSPIYGLRSGNICDFDLRITGLLKAGANTLVIANTPSAKVTNDLIVEEGRLEFRMPLAEAEKRGAPIGPLPEFIPDPIHMVDYSVRQDPNNDLVLTIHGETFNIESEFSTPEPKWQKTSNRYFTLLRQVEQRAEVLLVRDTLTNLTDDTLPVMQRHRMPMNAKKVWLAGASPASMVGVANAPENPTIFGVTEKTGIGLLPLDDVFQVHATNFSDGQSIGLEDRHLVLKPRATHISEWAIVLSAKPDYFALINAARRLRDVNFSIDGPFAFLRADPRNVGKWSDQQVAEFIRCKDPAFLCISIAYPQFKGRYPHGTAFQSTDFSQWNKEIARRRRIAPQVKQVPYFHCFIDASDDPEAKFFDSRLLRNDGTQGDYGQSFYKIFVPTESNSYGRAVSRNVDIAFDDLGFDGIYWDEMEYSAFHYHYGEPWDGVSADIDPKTMRVTRLKSSVALITQPWRLALAKRILARGPLIGNGAPHTRSMAQLQFPRFAETGVISNCTKVQLFTPIALGDHLTERSELDAYRVMLRALDYGCVYYWYNDLTVVPTHPTITSYMFPITPLELHEGFIIGVERILTNRSGIFGWNDGAMHDIHVFDDEGREAKEFKAPLAARTFTRDGKTFSELRLPEDWSAAIIRKR